MKKQTICMKADFAGAVLGGDMRSTEFVVATFGTQAVPFQLQETPYNLQLVASRYVSQLKF